jgi:hypothetical protein
MNKRKAILLLAGILLLGYLIYTKTVSSNNTEGDSGTIFTPQEVVTMYMRATLGTIPGSLIDYDLAKTLLTDDMLSQWTDDSFVPISYGIQQGPDSIEFIDSKISEDNATVRVWGYWGEDVGRDWTFVLKKEDSAWLIYGIKVVEPTDRQ